MKYCLILILQENFYIWAHISVFWTFFAAFRPILVPDVKIPRLLRVLGIPNRSKMWPNEVLKIPQIGKIPNIYSHWLRDSPRLMQEIWNASISGSVEWLILARQGRQK